MTTRQSSTSSSTDPPARREAVLGVDTHGEVHVAAVISPLGKVLGTESFPATAAGYRQLLVRARKRGTVRRAGVEGTGTFGAGLSRYLLAQQVQVYEVNRPDRSARRLMGKSDPIDAEAAARAVLSGRARARAKSGDGPVHSARIFKLAKDSAVKASTQAINQLKGRPGHRRPRTAGTVVELGQCRVVPHLRVPQPTRWWGRRGCGGPGHPHDVAHARRAR